jgi:outer membrane receptor protein involved in Fe transport
MNIRFLQRSALISLCAISSNVIAQFSDDNSEITNEDEIYEVSVIGTRIAESIKDQSANVFVLGDDELGKVSAIHVQQALSRVPGVTMQRGSGQESLPGIRSAVLTGAGACGSVLILEEAIPVRGAGVCNVNELFDTHFEQAARIDVLRGASSAFFGSNALTGSINVSLPHEGDNEVSLELGSNNYVRTNGAFAYNGGRLYASISEDGGYRDNAGFKQQKISWRHEQQLGDWIVNAGATYTNLDQQTAGFIVGLNSYRDRSLARENLNPEAFRKSSSLRVWLKANKEFDNTARLNTTVYVRDTDMDFRLHFLPGKPLEQNQQQGFGWQSALTFTPREALELSFGFDGDMTDSNLQQTQDIATVGSAFLQATIPTGTHYDYEVDARQLAFFSHLDWSLNDRWKVVAGARLERIDYEYDNLALDGRTRDDGSSCGFGGCRYSRPADRKDSFTHVSPKLEFRYSPSREWRLSMSVADSFRAPQATELYRLQRAQIAANLDEVEAVSVELAATYDTDTFDFNVSVYRLKTDNVIIRDSSFFNIDGQSTLSQGVEFSVDKSLGPRLKIKSVGSIAKHTYSSDLLIQGSNIRGNRIDTAPEFVGALFLNWQATVQSEFELEVKKVSSYFLEPLNNSEYLGHTLVNLRGNYSVDKHLELSARILNLGDRDYAERADFTQFTDERYFPGQPRSFFIEANYRF